jgi:hypothetical protein
VFILPRRLRGVRSFSVRSLLGFHSSAESFSGVALLQLLQHARVGFQDYVFHVVIAIRVAVNTLCHVVNYVAYFHVFHDKLANLCVLNLLSGGTLALLGLGAALVCLARSISKTQTDRLARGELNADRPCRR